MNEKNVDNADVKISIEVSMSTEQLANFLQRLGDMGIKYGLNVDTNVDTEFERELSRPMTKKTFKRHWNSQGAGQAWQKIWAASFQYDSFPLQRVEIEDSDVEALSGNIPETLEWLDSGVLHGSGSQVATTILKRIHEERLAELTEL